VADNQRLDRGIPLGWRLVDCAFGVVGFVPVWLAWRWSGELESKPAPRHHAGGVPARP
jgi:hypothetical protein